MDKEHQAGQAIRRDHRVCFTLDPNTRKPIQPGSSFYGSAKLPGLDSNQQPFDYTDGEVSGVAEVVELHPIELDPAA